MDTMDLLRKAAKALPGPESGWLNCALARISDGFPVAESLRLTNSDRRRYRDAALIEAADALGESDNQWQKAQQLGKAVRRFEARIWPRVHTHLDPDLPPVDKALFRAFKTGAQPIRSARKLYELLK